mmetsp:Transcript_6242/g.14731  ORF Transcript_6242/g.14731 Transcript_6242/m.14731 type:complete len:86 (+) Transcript_6242:272-529(+)
MRNTTSTSSGLVALLAAAPLLLGRVGGSPSCPSAYEGTVPPPFDQSCQNACSTGADAGALVGPGVLTSGEASPYDVAGIYFGHQN